MTVTLGRYITNICVNPFIIQDKSTIIKKSNKDITVNALILLNYQFDLCTAALELI